MRKRERIKKTTTAAAVRNTQKEKNGGGRRGVSIQQMLGDDRHTATLVGGVTPFQITLRTLKSIHVQWRHAAFDYFLTSELFQAPKDLPG